MAELTWGGFFAPPVQSRVRPDPVQNRVKRNLEGMGKGRVWRGEGWVGGGLRQMLDDKVPLENPIDLNVKEDTRGPRSLKSDRSP